MPSPCSVYDVMERKSCEWVGEYVGVCVCVCVGEHGWDCESEWINEWHQNNMICCRVLVIKMYYNFRFIKCKDTAIIVSQTKHFDIHVSLNFTATHSSYHDGIVKFNPNSGQVYLCPNVHACTGIWTSWLIVFVTLDYNCNVNPHVFVFVFYMHCIKAEMGLNSSKAKSYLTLNLDLKSTEGWKYIILTFRPDSLTKGEYFKVNGVYCSQCYIVDHEDQN